VVGVSQTLFEFHVTVAVVAVPVEFTNARGEELLVPLASFQLGSVTIPATSVAAMATSSPTKSMLIALPDPLAAVTLRVAVVVLLSEPLVPVMVKVKLPVGVVLAAVTVSVELPPVLIEEGLNVPLAPVGRPLTLKLTEEVKPLTVLMLMTY